jgi:hypothetical protein
VPRLESPAEGVALELVQGDLTRLRDAGVSGGNRLILDTCTFHDFTPDQRARASRPMIRGVDHDGIEAASPAGRWSTLTRPATTHRRCSTRYSDRTSVSIGSNVDSGVPPRPNTLPARRAASGAGDNLLDAATSR